MAIYKCRKCGETGSSKCINCRTLFPSNQMATVINNNLSVEFEIDPRYPNAEIDSIRDMVIKMTVFPNKGTTELLPEEFFPAFIKNMAMQDEETMRIALCTHSWECVQGPCMFGCCTPKLLTGEYKTGRTYDTPQLLVWETIEVMENELHIEFVDESRHISGACLVIATPDTPRQVIGKLILAAYDSGDYQEV